MPATSSVTIDHDEIREWAEERGAKPCAVRQNGGGRESGILRFHFSGIKDESLEEISWDEFFRKFDENGLALLYQDEAAGGKRSNFNKFVSRDSAVQGDADRQRKAG